MKKSILFSLVICFLFLNPANPQVGKFLKNVKNNVTRDLLGTPEKSKVGPEPACACDPAELVMEIGKYKIDYTECDISVLDDGRVLLLDKLTDNYYINDNGTTGGPYKKTDPRVKQFEPGQKDENNDDGKANDETILKMCKGYATKSGDKFTLTFAGKTYGPYGMINSFMVTKSKDKFAAVVTENVAVTADEGKKMDQAMKNAKTEQEKMALAMQYKDEMLNKMMSGGGPQAMMPKIVTNVPDVNTDAFTALGGQLNGNLKYDEILLVSSDKISDLQGKKLISYSYLNCLPASMFLSSDNTRYACYNYGVLTFSDGKKLTELFNPHLVKTDGKVYLAYMYFSPKRNAIMQCKIPF
jgi:hypothetical protein